MTSVVFCTPTITRPYQPFLEAMERSVPALDAAGIEHQMVFEVGSVYISWSRSNMLQKAMKTDADTFVFLDHDMSWEPDALIRLIQHPGEVAAGDYRYKKPEEEYMGKIFTDDDGLPIVRPDGTLKAHAVPAGFLKVTRAAVERFKEAYPELQYGPDLEWVDLFNHGAYSGTWWGEDYAFSRRWRDLGGEIHLIPDLDLNHHTAEAVFPCNLHKFLLSQPGGSEAGSPPAPTVQSNNVVYITKREAQVVEGVRLGKQNKHIANDLNVADATVKAHLRNVMKKMKATNRTQVAVSNRLRVV